MLFKLFVVWLLVLITYAIAFVCFAVFEAVFKFLKESEAYFEESKAEN